MSNAFTEQVCFVCKRTEAEHTEADYDSDGMCIHDTLIDVTDSSDNNNRVAFAAMHIDHSIATGGNDISLYATATASTLVIACETNGDYAHASAHYSMHTTIQRELLAVAVRSTVAALFAQHDTDSAAHELSDVNYNEVCDSLLDVLTQ